MPAGSGRYAYRQDLDAANEGGIDPLRLADHLDPVEALEHLLPDDLELQLGEPHADAAVDAEAERQVDAWAGAVDDELIRPLDHFLVTVARDVPHHDAVAFFDLLAAELGILKRRTPHMGERRLPADHLRHHGID